MNNSITTNNTIITTNNTTTITTTNTTLAPSSHTANDTLITDDIDDAFLCSLCPDGSTPPFPDKLFLSVLNEEDRTSCGELDLVLRELVYAEDCQGTFEIIRDSFDPAVYCQCPTTAVVEQETGTDAGMGTETGMGTGICQLCPDGTNQVRDATINDAHCQALADLAASALTVDFCLRILDVDGLQDVCCMNIDTDMENSSGATNTNSDTTMARNETQGTQIPVSEQEDTSYSSTNGEEEDENDPETTKTTTSSARTVATINNTQIMTAVGMLLLLSGTWNLN